MNKRRLAQILIFCTVAGTVWYTNHHAPSKEDCVPLPNAKHVLTVFIHGTFNPGLGLLNFFDLFSDNVENSDYAKLVSSMRDDDFFYQEQPILARGLVAFEPTFAAPDGKHKLAAYPIARAYEETQQAMAPGATINHYYTFGWSGLLSQQARRKSAIDLTQALTNEYKTLCAKGITPKIRIIAHSHGGNVMLNIAALKQASTFLQAHPDITPENESLAAMVTLLREQDLNLDAFPHIDELVMFGTPIQDETSTYVHDPLFGTVYNFYSQEDVVQGADFFSTKRRASAQRLDLSTPSTTSTQSSRVIQAQLLVDHDPTEPVVQESRSLWATLFGGSSNENCKDPSHKDLWFLTWNSEFCQPNFPFKPLPMVTLTPLLLATLAHLPAVHDVDLHIQTEGDEITTHLHQHGKEQAQHSCSLPKELIERLKEQVLAWEPDRISKQDSFAKIYAQRTF